MSFSAFDCLLLKGNHIIQFHLLLYIRVGCSGLTMYDKIDNFNGVSILFRHLATLIFRYTRNCRGILTGEEGYISQEPRRYILKTTFALRAKKKKEHFFRKSP